MSIETTKAGTYRARWRDDTGKQRAQNFRTKNEAREHLKGVHGDLQRGLYVAPSAGATTVAEWAKEWLASAHDLGQGGRDTYERDLERHILPVVGDLPLRKLTPKVIDDYLATKAHLAASTRHRHHRTIKTMCAVAVERGKLARNPVELVKRPKLVDVEMRFLTATQVATLADTIAPRYRAWVLVAAYGGLRWSECVGLRRAAVDGDVIAVTEQMIRRRDGLWHRDPPKSKAGKRSVKLPPFLAAELVAHLDAYSAVGPDGLVFPNQNGDPMNGPSFTGNVYKPALERAGIDGGTRIHDLRHTAVALAVAAGAHPKAIQVRMGHASIAVTLDRYGHVFPESDEQVALGLEAVWSADRS